jgi:hypothetical protein
VTSVGRSGAVWYSGAPQATDFGQDAANQALVVDAADGAVVVDTVEVGSWHFVAHDVELATPATIDRLDTLLAGLPGKERTVVKLGITGTINLTLHTRLDAVLEQARDLLGGLVVSSRRSDHTVVADASAHPPLPIGIRCR